MRTGERDTLVTIERRSVTRDASYGSEVVSWVTHAQAWARLVDVVAYERVDNGLASYSRRRYFESLYIPGVTSDMRVRVNDTGALYQIVTVTEAPRRMATMMNVEEYSVAGA